jgi:hypothetical protein
VELNRVRIEPAGENPVIALRGVEGWKTTETVAPAGAKELVRTVK